MLIGEVAPALAVIWPRSCPHSGPRSSRERDVRRRLGWEQDPLGKRIHHAIHCTCAQHLSGGLSGVAVTGPELGAVTGKTYVFLLFTGSPHALDHVRSSHMCVCQLTSVSPRILLQNRHCVESVSSLSLTRVALVPLDLMCLTKTHFPNEFDWHKLQSIVHIGRIATFGLQGVTRNKHLDFCRECH